MDHSGERCPTLARKVRADEHPPRIGENMNELDYDQAIRLSTARVFYWSGSLSGWLGFWTATANTHVLFNARVHQPGVRG